MFKRIMVCLDGSRLAEQVLPYAAAEALSFNIRVTLFQAIPEPIMVSPGIPGAAPVPVETESQLQQAQKADAEARSYLEEIAKPLREKSLDVDTVTMPGMAGQAITSYADKSNIDLIAIATHGRSGLGRAVFGSVADFVLRESGLPILVIKPQVIEKPLPIEFQPFKKILVCLDGSELAEQILPYAMEQAQHFGSKMVLLQAYVMPTMEAVAAAQASPAGASDLMDQGLQRLRNEAMVYLEKVAESMKEKGLDVVCVALQGVAGSTIVGYGQNEVVDLITLSTHGRSGLGRTIFGSVADHVLRESGLPILLIKPQEVKSQS